MNVYVKIWTHIEFSLHNIYLSIICYFNRCFSSYINMIAWFIESSSFVNDLIKSNDDFSTHRRVHRNTLQMIDKLIFHFPTSIFWRVFYDISLLLCDARLLKSGRELLFMKGKYQLKIFSRKKKCCLVVVPTIHRSLKLTHHLRFYYLPTSKPSYFTTLNLTRKLIPSTGIFFRHFMYSCSQAARRMDLHELMSDASY